MLWQPCSIKKNRETKKRKKKKKQLELTSEEHQSGFNQNVSAAFWRSSYIKEMPFVAPDPAFPREDTHAHTHACTPAL